jgi:hypothetical protein
MAAQIDSASSPLARRRSAGRFVSLAVVAILVLVFHAPLLRLVLAIVIVHEPLPARVDAVLLYRDGDDRHGVAAGWFRHGFITTILLPRELPNRNVALGILPAKDTFDRQRLEDLGVSSATIYCLDTESLDPHYRGEWRFARLLGDWLQTHPESTAVVLCRRFETRLTRQIIRRVLPPEAAQRTYVHGLPSLAYDERTWWRSRQASVQMFHALLGLAYAQCAGEDLVEPITWDVDTLERQLIQRSHEIEQTR